MRVKNSIYNIGSNFIIFFVKTVLTFIVRSVLIARISQECIGLNGLFTNILSILSLSELGLSSAIGFSLYKPLAENDENKVSRLMSFYKKSYIIVGTTIFLLGLLVIPILPFIVKETISDMTTIYLLFLINTCSLYFISYKDVLITSDQKAYKLTKINLLFTVLISIFELIVLYLTSNFVFFLTVQFFISIIQRIIINVYISKKYKNINFSTPEKLDTETKNTIFKNIKAMLYHKIGDAMINGTDNIIISSFININMVSIYSNYLLVTSYLNSFVGMIYNGILASLGNLIVTENDEKKYEIFKKANFLGFSLFSFFSICVINLINIFIVMFANENYLLGMDTVILIVLNFYITGLRVPVSNMKIASGLFDIDKYTPIIQSIINIVFSITLSKFIGINGVLIGTLFSSIVPSIQRPFIVYKYILKRDTKEYFKEYIKQFIFTFVIMGITFYINSLITLDSNILTFILRGITSASMFLTIYLYVYRKKDEFLYYKDMIKNILRREKYEC